MKLVWIVVAIPLASGCAASKSQQAADLDARLVKLEQEEARRSAKLVELEHEIEIAEQSLATAQTEAKRAECRAKKALVEAELTEAVAKCGAQLARHEACLARNDASVSKSATIGCGLGILSAVVTGGATAPLTIAGCAGGALAGKARTATCGEAPSCFETLQTQRKQAVREVHGLEVCATGLSREDRRPSTQQHSQPRPGPQVHP